MDEPYDLIIIGSGIAAQSVLSGLAPGYKGKICIIEVGEHRRSKVRFQTRNSPISVAKRRIRAFGVGGTSIIWGGNLIPFTRSEINNGGWGISSDELISFLPSALQVLGFKDHVNDILDDWQSYLASEGANKFSTQAQYRQLSQKNRLVSPQSTGVEFELEMGLFAEEVNRLPGGWEVISTDGQGKEHRTVGRNVVIANGNLESLRLMQKSGFDRANAFGKYWSGHLQLVIGTLSTRGDSPLATETRGQVIRQEFLHLPTAGVPGHSAWKVQLFSVRNSLLTLLELRPFDSLRTIYRLILDLLGGRRTYFVNLDGDQIPTPNSKVTFTRKGKLAVSHLASHEDVDALMTALNLLENIALKGQLSAFSRNPSRLLRNSKTTSHQLGGARIGTTPREGVVDQNLEVFGNPGLYVCSTSVFRSFSAANPTLMLCQLGLRLGNHLSHLET